MKKIGQPQRLKRGRYTAHELRKNLFVLVLTLAFIVVCLGIAGYLVYKGLGESDFFQVTATNIKGCRRTTKNQILELSGIDIHTNILAMNKSQVKSRIEKHEWVESVDIVREWPNLLIISVKERVPVALVNVKDGLYYLDRNGVAFARVLPPEDMDFPVITGLTAETWPAKVTGSPLEEALDFLKYAGQGGAILPKQSISEIHLGADGGITLYLVDRPFPIRLGKGDILSKYQRLAKVLYRLYKGKEFSDTVYIDMEYLTNKVLVRKQDAV